MWLTWQQAGWLGVACAIVSAVLALLLARSVNFSMHPKQLRAARLIQAITREVAIIAGLYALWQRVFALTVTRTAGAIEHARSVYHFEQRIGLPSELTVQRWTMRSTWLIRHLNTFYAYVHVPALGLMIVWLFFRHRERYPRVRNVLALATGACLAIQSIPVAPPRFLPDLGFVDTGLLYGQSVYGTGGSGISNQLAAMPSVHVCWSTLVAGAVIWASKSKWRWLVLIHPIITFWAVVATGNHWWADGIVAWILLAAAIGVLETLSAMRRGLFGGVPGAAEPDRQGDDRVPVTSSA